MPKLKDKGFDRIVKQMGELRGVEFGLFSNSGTYPDGTPVVDVGIYNEFGTSRIPARPFMRVAADQGKKSMQQVVDHTIGLMIDGRVTPKAVDDTVGKQWANVVKSTIKHFDTPPNAPSTVAAKGKNDPLVDTGQMMDAIDYRRR